VYRPASKPYRWHVDTDVLKAAGEAHTLHLGRQLTWLLRARAFRCVSPACPSHLCPHQVYGKYYRKLSKRVQTALAEANAVAEEVLSAMTTVGLCTVGFVLHTAVAEQVLSAMTTVGAVMCGGVMSLDNVIAAGLCGPCGPSCLQSLCSCHSRMRALCLLCPSPALPHPAPTACLSAPPHLQPSGPGPRCQ
jgi:hypothetical protein